MTRFRAYATDSEDDDGNESVSSSSSSVHSERNLRMDQDNAQSDSGESMVEEELFESAPRHRSRIPARNEDSGSEDDEQSDDDDGVHSRQAIQIIHASKSPPPISRRNNPTIIPRARELGIDPQKMHVMQTSLFRMPEEEAAMKALAQAAPRRKLQLSLPPNRKHRRDSEGEGLRADPGQRASFAHDIEPAPYRPSRKYARVEGAASAVSGSEGAFVDAGLAFGRSFRVGWGPGGTLVHLGQLCGPQSKLKTTANTSIVQKTTVPILAVSAAESSEAALKLLSQHLSNTPIESDADGIPFANPSPSFTFSNLLTQFPPTDHSFEACLFRLGHTLFDPIELRLPESTPMDVRNRISTIRRKAALSNWLQDSISPTVQAELRDNPGAEWAAVVFTLLTGNQIDKACEVAMDSGNVKLASLIAQCPGDEEFRSDLQEQLALWRTQRIDAHIDTDVRKIYALLAGTVHVLEGSGSTGVEQCSDVNVSMSLGWKRAFGLHLWFSERMDTPLADVFRAYDRLWRQPGSGVASPVPWYTEQDAMHSQWKLRGSANPPDALFSLIGLFADPACSLSNILAPLSFSASPVDYRVAWHLYIVLSRCLRVRDFPDRQPLGIASDSESEGTAEDEQLVEGHSPSADLLANSYALQLEQAGMVQEAAFVLLHIEGSAGRAKAVKELLNRSAAKLDDWMTRGLVGSLKLPVTWVNEAKAIYALDIGDVYGAYELYVAGGLWNAAHELAVLELAPDAVIRQDLALLNDLFDKFRGHVVDGWHVRGKVFLDYVHAMTRLPELREHFADASAVPDAALASELEQLARSVPKLISILPDILRDRADVRHNAALMEMTAGLTLRLDQVKPLAITAAQVRTSAMSDATKLRNLQTSAYERFMRSVEIA